MAKTFRTAFTVWFVLCAVWVTLLVISGSGCSAAKAQQPVDWRAAAAIDAAIVTLDRQPVPDTPPIPSRDVGQPPEPQPLDQADIPPSLPPDFELPKESVALAAPPPPSPARSQAQPIVDCSSGTCRVVSPPQYQAPRYQTRTYRRGLFGRRIFRIRR